MATQVLTNAYFAWNSVDLSDHATSITLNYEAEEVEDTAFSLTTRSRKGGLKNWTMDVEFNNDEASSKVAQTFFPDVGVQRTVEVRPDSGSRSATNPGYNGTGLLVSFPPLQGRVGELSKTTIRIVSAGTLARSTS